MNRYSGKLYRHEQVKNGTIDVVDMIKEAIDHCRSVWGYEPTHIQVRARPEVYPGMMVDGISVEGVQHVSYLNEVMLAKGEALRVND
jgi:hypothetical protein